MEPQNLLRCRSRCSATLPRLGSLAGRVSIKRVVHARNVAFIRLGYVHGKRTTIMSAPKIDCATSQLNKTKKDRGTPRCTVCSTPFGTTEEVLDHEWSCRSSATSARAAVPISPPAPPTQMQTQTQTQTQRIPGSLAGFRFGGHVLAQTLPMPLPVSSSADVNTHPYPYTNAGWSGVLPGPAAPP